MDKEQIKKAIDNFEKDKFTDAKEIIAKEIADKRDEFLKDKLDLSNDINPKKEDKKED